MRRLEEILDFNKNFVKNKEYEKYKATKKPEKKLVILSCMDTRLTELLPKAMNIKNGDAKIIKKRLPFGYSRVKLKLFVSPLPSFSISLQISGKQVYLLLYLS